MDPRFFTPANGADALVSLVDADDLDQIEAVLMFLIDRPLSLIDGDDEDGQPALEIEILAAPDGMAWGAAPSYPLTLAGVVRGCLELTEQVPPYGPDSAPMASSDMTDQQLSDAMSRAFGKARIAAMLGIFDDPPEVDSN